MNRHCVGPIGMDQTSNKGPSDHPPDTYLDLQSPKYLKPRNKVGGGSQNTPDRYLHSRKLWVFLLCRSSAATLLRMLFAASESQSLGVGLKAVEVHLRCMKIMIMYSFIRKRDSNSGNCCGPYCARSLNPEAPYIKPEDRGPQYWDTQPAPSPKTDAQLILYTSGFGQ